MIMFTTGLHVLELQKYTQLVLILVAKHSQDCYAGQSEMRTRTKIQECEQNLHDAHVVWAGIYAVKVKS